MLVLTRRVGETLLVGDSVTVIVLGVKGNQVRVGIDALREVEVHREEVCQRINEPALAKDKSTWVLPPQLRGGFPAWSFSRLRVKVRSNPSCGDSIAV